MTAILYKNITKSLNLKYLPISPPLIIFFIPSTLVSSYTLYASMMLNQIRKQAF